MSSPGPLAPHSQPRLPSGVRLQFDARRDAWVILAPERVLFPDPIAVEILQRCDGDARIEAIADELAARYDAPREQICADVIELLADLAEKGFVES